MPEGTLVNNRYRLDALPLARGGMGEVYSGRDLALDREVAVKLIHFAHGTPSEEMVRRFLRESRITARLQHPGVPAIYDVGEHGGWPFLVMQKIEGITVADLIAENGALPVGWAVAIAAQVCATLVAAHRASLIHRDLKPSNLILDTDGAIKVLDFGLAVAFDVAQFSTITGSGQSVGTPAYMAPEQVNATAIGPKTDLYALGCTLHEMLTGEVVFSGSSPFAVMTKQVHERPQPMRELRPDVPPVLESLVLELLEKDPQRRPQSAGAVYDRLLPFIADMPVLPEVLGPPTAPNPVRMYSTVLSRLFAPASSEPPRTHSAAGATVPTGPSMAAGALPWFAPGNNSGPARFGSLSVPRFAGQQALAGQPALAHPSSGHLALRNPPFGGQTTPANAASANPATSGSWRFKHSLWLLVPILGFSCLSGLGLVYVGIRARRPAWWIPGALYAAFGWLGFVTVGVSDQTSAASNWGTGGLLLAWVGSILHSALVNSSWLRWQSEHQPWYAQPWVPPPPTSMSPYTVPPASLGAPAALGSGQASVPGSGQNRALNADDGASGLQRQP